MSIHAIMKGFFGRAIPLMSKIETLGGEISQKRLKDMQEVYQRKAWNIDTQALLAGSFTLAGAGCSIASGQFKAIGSDYYRIFKTFAQFMPEARGVAQKFQESQATSYDSLLASLNSRQTEMQQIQKNNSSSKEQLLNTAAQLLQQDNAAYHLK